MPLWATIAVAIGSPVLVAIFWVYLIRPWYFSVRKSFQTLSDKMELRSSKRASQIKHEKERFDEDGECSFWFVPREAILEHRGKLFPVFQELRDRDKQSNEDKSQIQRVLKPVSREKACNGELTDVVAVSHRWMSEELPDVDGCQLKKIQEYLLLEENENIKWVWYDYWWELSRLEPSPIVILPPSLSLYSAVVGACHKSRSRRGYRRQKSQSFSG